MRFLLLPGFIFLFLTGLSSCSLENDCPTCFTPPEPFNFELVDKETGENLFSNGTYELDQIQIINIVDESTIEYDFISENNINIIQLKSIGWETEIVNYRFDHSGNELFKLKVDAVRKNDDCCSYTEYNEVVISNVEYEFVEETGVFKIKI
ncbi:hypothetical protein OO013_00470 [Mangrovivirga sp. M17]|uniref:Lipoprotein n=1 Tax=Mangrovivirga halotolerans TaxID=2993936 RepID=A0ABT3RLZ8_9BACT|nr:hypothetical protein [Mangrovivirga halotolerans]MCX2742312.1 hypothetical protein [Mangrovivirga halotolerans]